LDKYYIKNGDSLESIAEELGLKVQELINYHNDNSKLHDNIRDKNLPKWSDHIIIADTVDNLKMKKKLKNSPDHINIFQRDTEPIKYLITQKIDMQVSGNSMIDSETEIIWKYKKQKKDGSFHANLEQESHQIKYIKSIYRALAEYMQKFNKPLEHLILKLSDTGEIDEVENQEEINKQWLEFKKNLTPELGNTPEEKHMIESGDKDFSDSLPLLKNNTLYDLFFSGIYGEHEVSDKFEGEEKKKYISQIFSSEKVNIITKKKFDKDGELIKVKLYSEADSTNNHHLKSIYDEKLRPFFQEEYNYSFSWSVEYSFNPGTGIMVSCNSKIKEMTGSSYNHVMEHIIQLVKN